MPTVKNAKKAAALLLAIIMLSACGTPAAEPTKTPEDEASGEIVALVPLDDRPDNVECTEYIAQMVGYELVMPDSDLYSTKLNNQPLNSNGTQSGDRAALYEWVLKQEKEGCDRYIICLDQLLSGGLVASRAMTGNEDVVLSDGTCLSETEMLESLIDTLSKDENNRVWLLDTVMRLAPTVGYLDWTAEDYNSIRSYASQPRPELGEYSVSGVKALYRQNADGEEISADSFSVDSQKLESYLSARERKLTLTDKLLRLVSAQDNNIFRVLIGIDDSSEAESIQKNEIAYFESLLRDCDTILSGVDDLEFKSVSRMYLDDISWGGADAELRYFGGLEDEAACIYDYRPLSEIVSEHFEFFNLNDTETNNLQVLVLTKPENEAEKENYCDALIAAINENRENKVPTILIDASDKQYGDLFRNKLLKNADIGWLIGYAGFLDMAIITGTALSRGVSRYACLMQGDANSASNEAYMKMMTDAVVRDFCYVGNVRDKVNRKITESFGGQTSNFYEPEIDVSAITDYMSRLMTKESSNVLKNLEKSEYISSLTEYETSEWENIEICSLNFPWNRAFEIRMDILIKNS